MDKCRKKSNLNDGNGDPCAGHFRERIASACLLNVSDLSSEENFGAALPIGSEKSLLFLLGSHFT